MNGQDYVFEKNLQGDIIRIYDENFSSVVKYTYDAWGKILSIDGTGASTIGEYNSLRYRGYYYDSDTGLYYLNSRYYDPVMCRFVNADGYASTGQGIKGHNMYVYCLYNPVAYYDNGYCAIAWQNGYQGPCPGIGSPGCMDNVYIDAANYKLIEPILDPALLFSVTSTAAEVGVKTGLEMGKHAYQTASRPANIGSGVYAKMVKAKVTSIDKALAISDKTFTVASYAGVALETCINIDANCRAGKSFGKIAWDATVDTLILGTNTCISMAIGAAIGTAIPIPGLGTLLGAVGGYFVGLVLDVISDEPKNFLKSLI